MSETRVSSPIDHYYNHDSATFSLMEQGQSNDLTVVSRRPCPEDIWDCVAEAEWRIFEDPRSTRQFEGLVFNPTENGSTLLVPTTAGEYNDRHMYEGALWAAQNPSQRLVLLTAFNLTPRELAYYSQTGRLTDGEGLPLPSMLKLANALGSGDIEVTGIYGRSAGTKEASVLSRVMPTVSAVVLGAPPQLVERSTKAFVGSALSENSEQRLVGGYSAVDPYQVNRALQVRTAQARKGSPERQRPTGAIAATVGNMAVRLAHALALAKGSEAFMADLRNVEIGIDAVVYTEDALYGRDSSITTNLTEAFSSENGCRGRVLSIPGGHRLPERYPCLTNDITDMLLLGAA